MVKKAKSKSPAYRFLHTALSKSPDASYADLAKRAKANKIKLAPVLYGKVKLDLGLVKRKAKTPLTYTRPDFGKRGRGRPRKVATMDGIAAQINQLQQDRDGAIAKLESIRAILQAT